jgi:2-acylglycerol O-acyltransferase 2
LAVIEASGTSNAVRDGEACVVGFHPHGVLPIDAALATLRWPRGRAIICTDAFTHVIPWMRDLGQWLGAREVTREAIGMALRSGASVVLVPGGQAELFATSSTSKQVRVYRGHRGFIRVALQHRARLVPAFSFGEWELMDNVRAPRMQRWTRSWLGFPVPFWPYGRWGLPLPRRPPRGIRVVVGRPVDLPVDGAVDEAAVEAVHRAYFEALRDLFERHKVRAGYGDHELVFFDAPLDAAKAKGV